MNKIELEEFIWDTRRDFFNYLIKGTLTSRNFEELDLANQAIRENINNLGIKTETEYQLAMENIELKKEVELLKKTIKLLKPQK